MLSNKRNLSERQFERLVGNLLRYGVFLATCVVFLGGVLYLVRHGYETPNYQIFHGEPPYFSSPEGVATAAFSGRRLGIIQLGLLLLIITPVARVAFSLLAFMRQRDSLYTMITIIVLLGLAIGLTGN
ncbi:MULTISPECIES: DUF1634 domain-containing protein [Nostoc]|uniref:DUF1634 domain-containing protein n=1 Tax=Nostoc paludosum FACHB-159 TaxID=2692908 RepID=A0ABR8KFX3_9NOSO|nr:MULTISPECIES: DUF1634 domain-containing protein [Nostoc]MBD2681299.1 DUF1634 domain-containing protein [Nostoc sp. FACHB-857]MBD2737778.1 DUF1634 domain-containing protein [Nostoc paludosum FACHB-159]